MASISTRILIKQGEASAELHEDGFLKIWINGKFIDNAEALGEYLYDLKCVISTLQQHMTDSHGQ